MFSCSFRSYTQVFNPFELIFEYSVKQRPGLVHFLCPFSFPTHLLKRLSFTHCVFLAPLSKRNFYCMCMDLFLGSLFC